MLLHEVLQNSLCRLVGKLKRWRAQLLCGMLMVCLLGLGSSPAFAQACPAPTVTTMAFGNVSADILAGNTVDITSTITYACTGFPNNAPVRMCFTLSGFTAGVRRMVNGGNTIDFQIYKEAARTTVWGTNTTPTTTSALVNDTTSNGTGVVSGSVTLYGRVLTGQNTDPPAAYTVTIPGNNPNQRITAQANTTNACSTITGANRNFALTATATISAHCTVSVTNMNFGNQANLSANRDATSTVTARCTSTTPYNIGISAGTGSGATVTTRKMTSAASNTINYSLYRNAAYTQVWGETIGTNTVAATGNGTDQVQTVYGRVPVQAIPNPATYNDTVVVTVTY